MQRLLAALFAVGAAVVAVADTQVVCSITPQAQTACSALTVSQAAQLDPCRCNPTPTPTPTPEPSVYDDAIALWKLDETSSTRADSIGSLDLTDNNTVGYVNLGPQGTVASFVAASNESLTKADDPSLDVGSTGVGAAYAVWFKSTGNSVGYGSIISRGVGGVRPLELLTETGGVSPLYARVEGGTSAQISFNITTGVWIFVVANFDPADKKLRLYYDGVLVATSAAVANASLDASDQPLEIGGSGTLGEITGNLSRAGIWNRVLLESEITALYNSGLGKSYSDLTTAEKVGLVSYWNLDEASGNRADSHGSNTLTDNNTVTSVDNTHPGFGKAASFVAANSEYLSIASQVIPSNSDFTLVHWEKTQAGEAQTGMLSWKTSTGTGSQPGIFFEPVNGSNHRQYTRRGNGVGIEVGDNRGNWVLVIYEYVHSTTTHRLMVMGAAANDATFTSADVAAVANNSGLYVGGPDAPIYNNGLISNMALWSRVLTTQERTDLYNAGAGLFYED